MFTATGIYQKTWTNKAKQNLVHQVPHIAKSFPTIGDYYPATINVRFGPMIIVAGSDCRTPPIKWKPAGEDGETGEVFDLVRCRIAVGPNPPADALMYAGHWSWHRLDPHKHEFLVTRFIPDLEDGMPVTLTCDRPAIDLPYSKHRDGDAARTIVVL